MLTDVLNSECACFSWCVRLFLWSQSKTSAVLLQLLFCKISFNFLKSSYFRFHIVCNIVDFILLVFNFLMDMQGTTVNNSAALNLFPLIKWRYLSICLSMWCHVCRHLCCVTMVTGVVLSWRNLQNLFKGPYQCFYMLLSFVNTDHIGHISPAHFPPKCLHLWDMVFVDRLGWSFECSTTASLCLSLYCRWNSFTTM